MLASRREILRFGGTLLAATAVPAEFFGSTAKVPFSDALADRLASLSKKSFLPLVNSSFTVHSGEQTKGYLILLSVEETKLGSVSYREPMAVLPQPSRLAPPELETFMLRFHGSGDALSQGTYELEHAVLDRFALFIVPSGNFTYTAVINRLLTPVSEAPPARSVHSRGPLQEDLKSVRRPGAEAQPFK